MIFLFFKNLFTDLYRQPLRTILTLSGVIWGTFAIVLLLAFGDSVSRRSIKNIHGMGQGIVLLWPGTTTMEYKGFTRGKDILVTPEDVLVIPEKVPGIRYICPEMRATKRIRYQREEYNNTLRGVNPGFQHMRNTIPLKGRFIDDLDIECRRRVCFLGKTLAQNLFKEEEAVGKQVFIEGIPFVVIGVMIEKIQSSNYSGQRDEHCIFIPFTTYMGLYGDKYISNIVYQPWNVDDAPEVTRRLRHYLGNNLGFSPQDNDALFIWDFTEMEKQINIFFLAFRIFLGMIGAFTLLVGGVGVASIMLVVVEERTREIGIKLAVGAKRRQILLQFFSESMVIISMGGVIGFALAALLVRLLPVQAIEDFVGVPQINHVVGMATILVLLVIGGISGLVPARKAASTDPIEALRH